MSVWQDLIDWWSRLFPPPPPPIPTPADLVAAINEARRRAGRAWLTEEPDLSSIARESARRMAASGVLAHGDDLNRIVARFPGAAAGEDIGMGYPTAGAMVQGWLSDLPHRAILLGSSYSRVGVGVARGSVGLFWVADFLSGSRANENFSLLSR